MSDLVDIYGPAIADLEQRIAAMQATLDSLRALVSGGSLGTAPVANASRATGAASFGNDAFFNMTIADASRKYLEGLKRTSTARAIAEALLAGGFKSTAKNFIENVRSILSRSSTFVLVNGEFGLAEWYPGRKPVRRIKIMDTDSPEESDSAIILDASSGQPQPV